MAQRPSRARQKLQLHIPLHGGHCHSYPETMRSVRCPQHTHNQMGRKSFRDSPNLAEHLGPPLHIGYEDRGRRTGPSLPHTLDYGSWFWCRLFSGGTGGKWFPGKQNLHLQPNDLDQTETMCSTKVQVGPTVELLYTFSRTLWQIFCSSDSVMSSTGRTT